MADELADVLENRVMREILATGNPTETDSPAHTLREFLPEQDSHHACRFRSPSAGRTNGAGR